MGTQRNHASHANPKGGLVSAKARPLMIAARILAFIRLLPIFVEARAERSCEPSDSWDERLNVFRYAPIEFQIYIPFDGRELCDDFHRPHDLDASHGHQNATDILVVF